MLTANQSADFRNLIDGDAAEELACGRFLESMVPTCRERILRALVTTRHGDIAGLASANISPLRLEGRLAAGRADLMVTLNATDGDNQRSMRCLVWELKAPQLAAFRSVTGVRWGATHALMEAEEQLLHYVSELKRNGVALADGTRISAENIFPAGIIIGRDMDIPGDMNQRILYSQAKQIRRADIHERVGMQLINWDYVYQRLTEPQ